ncbi:MAG: glutamate-1-semialdehyde 2,1-aminomutase [Deltaproteobacteria bacterium]|jgi:glutamate-1-semialdehyde 2,1-aminomutase|nr:glutamate-1-semialdehyde 2,1-aminomutase [Deltaproteobacteria bacterium]
MTEKTSLKLFEESQKLIPGGVNSPVRACRAVGTTPRFVSRGRGARIFDVEGDQYYDFVSSWGPLIFGHASPNIINDIREALSLGTSYGAPTERELILARLISEHVPSVEMLRLVSSGTEAAMSAVRLARGFTGRDRILKFTGCYHGHADSLLVEAGSGVITFGIPGSKGVPEALARLTISAPYNDAAAAEEVFSALGGEIACVIVEPVAGNMGVVPPEPGFLEKLRELATRHGSLLVFDEVITGFRLGLSGAQGLYRVTPDLTILGKIVGGGLPLAAFGGRRDVMERLAPLGDVYQAGTLSGNPLAVTAGISALRRLKAEPGCYGRINHMGKRWAEGLLGLVQRKGIPATVNHVGSMSTLFFTEGPVRDYDSALKSDTDLYAKYYRGMLARGVWLPPSQFEASFTSAGFIFEEIDLCLEMAEEVINSL